MPRYVSPAGTPIRTGDLIRALRAALTGATTEDRLHALSVHFGVRYAWGASSGRAALDLTLRGLRQLRPDRTVVAVPAYTCFSVAAAIARAGLTLFPVEVNPDTLDFDHGELKHLPEKILLCIVTANHFGYVGDIKPVQQVAKETGAFVIDNAAQALGALRDGQFAGTRGDVGIFSLGRGKSLSAIEGGLIVANSDAISQAVGAQVEHLQPAGFIRTAHLLLQLAAYLTFLRPSRYWIPNSLPFLKLGATEFDPRFPVHALQSIALHLLSAQLDRLPEINGKRRSNAVRLTEGLRAGRTFCFPQPAAGTQAALVRLPVVAPDETLRNMAVKRLRQAHIGASSFYPSSICDIPGIGSYMSKAAHHCRNAERLSRTLFTLPVHPLVEHADIDRMIAVLRDMEQESVYRAPYRECLSAKEVQ